MQHKNIAVLMTALDSDAQAETLKGIEEYAKSRGWNIAVFLWFTVTYEKDKHNLGEINIVNLPDLNLFDGVILFANALHIENNKEEIEKLLDNLTCPIVCIGCKFKDSPQVRTDNYASMKELVEHYVVDHKMTRIHFVKGIEKNADATERFQAYVDVLKEHDIPIVPERISQGDFDVAGGKFAAKEILKSNLEFPEAIVCANDVMAITICDILMEKGYRVPEDVVISGYDYSVEGQQHFPKITSVRCRFKELGEKTCQVLADKIDGKEVPAESLLPDEIVLNESCGCKNEIVMDDEEPRNIAQRRMIHQMIMFEKNIIEVDSFEEWIRWIKEFMVQINPTEFYCCANEDFEENVFDIVGIEQEDMSQEEKLAYSSKVKVIIAYQNEMFKKKASFESKYAFSDLFNDSTGGKLYIFSPMHYLERNFGYFVFVDSTFPISNQLYISWLINMGNSIENIRKQSLLKNAMTRLDEMYVRDSLTDVYNRFGMDRYFAELKRRCMMLHIPMQVSFVDVDGLKEINDKYGHGAGDKVIRSVADILKKLSKRSYVVRYGGDEFVVMGSANDIEEVQEYWEQVEAEIKEYNQTSGSEAKISLSYGYDLFQVDVTTSAADCIRIVDKKMYEAKNAKKLNR